MSGKTRIQNDLSVLKNALKTQPTSSALKIYRYLQIFNNILLYLNVHIFIFRNYEEYMA